MRDFKIKQSKQDAFKLIKKAALNMGLNLREESHTSGTLNMTSDGSLFSFGNNIDIKISKTGQSECSVKVSSKSAVLFQLIDWGVNKEIEEQLVQEIKKIL